MTDPFPPAMRFGIFVAPFHPVEENPDLALRRDFELVEWLDHLGFNAIHQEIQRHVAEQKAGQTPG